MATNPDNWGYRSPFSDRDAIAHPGPKQPRHPVPARAFASAAACIVLVGVLGFAAYALHIGERDAAVPLVTIIGSLAISAATWAFGNRPP
ncbi:MAG: hypothetical protein ACOZNI_19495 [Myxococcota bacterium]